MNFRTFKNKFLFTNYPDVGLLLLRIGLAGSMLMAHGVDKFSNFAELSRRFPDPIGLGSGVALTLATFAEFVCSIAVICGLFTRPATLFLIITMAVAVFVIHANDSFENKELAYVYLVGFVALFFTGPGRYSIDRKL